MKRNTRGKKAKDDSPIRREPGMNWKLLLAPQLEVRKRFQAATEGRMREMCLDFEDNFRFLLRSKAELKEIFRQHGGDDAVPATPKRGGQLARIQETIDMFEQFAVKEEIVTPGHPPPVRRLEIEDEHEVEEEMEVVAAASPVRREPLYQIQMEDDNHGNIEQEDAEPVPENENNENEDDVKENIVKQRVRSMAEGERKKSARNEVRAEEEEDTAEVDEAENEIVEVAADVVVREVELIVLEETMEEEEKEEEQERVPTPPPVRRSTRGSAKIPTPKNVTPVIIKEVKQEPVSDPRPDIRKSTRRATNATEKDKSTKTTPVAPAKVKEEVLSEVKKAAASPTMKANRSIPSTPVTPINTKKKMPSLNLSTDTDDDNVVTSVSRTQRRRIIRSESEDESPMNTPVAARLPIKAKVPLIRGIVSTPSRLPSNPLIPPSSSTRTRTATAGSSDATTLSPSRRAAAGRSENAIQPARSRPIARAVRELKGTRAPQVPHEHIVNTPTKPERREQVQRIIALQDEKREQSAARSPARSGRSHTRQDERKAMADQRDRPKTPMKKSVHGQKVDIKKQKYEEATRMLELQKQKMETAQISKEEQNREKAERARREREEKQRRAQMKREKQDAEAKRKADLARDQLERAAALRMEEKEREKERLRSPGRSKPASRLASPARVKASPMKQNREKDFKKQRLLMLSPITPGRTSAKAAKLVRDSGNSDVIDRASTYNSPARDVRRKSRPIKQEAEDEEMEHSGVEILQPAKPERMIKRATSNGRKIREADEQRAAEETAKELERKEIEAALRRDAEAEEKRQRAAAIQKLREENERRLAKEEAERRAVREAEEKRRKEKEEADRIAKEAENERMREEAAMMELASKKEICNKHLANVTQESLNSSDISSYDMTPEKVYKPASADNYNIDDISSGDETDDEDAPRKPIPAWAAGDQLRNAVLRQSEEGAYDLEAIFGPIQEPDLTKIFGQSKKYPRRGSSACWDSPLSKPTKGVSKFFAAK